MLVQATFIENFRLSCGLCSETNDLQSIAGMVL